MLAMSTAGGPLQRPCPGYQLRWLAAVNDMSKRFGQDGTDRLWPAPSHDGRLSGPDGTTFTIQGRGSTCMTEGIPGTVAWLHTHEPDEYRR